LRLGHVQLGDRLPTVRDVASQLAVNPNTVLKAYRQLEAEGLVESRPGLGIFVAAALEVPGVREQARLRRELERWLDRAFAAGLDDQAIGALVTEVRRSWKRAAA
jgi:GntR family transcriptional regulator